MENTQKEPPTTPTLMTIFGQKIKQWIMEHTLFDCIKLVVMHSFTIFITFLSVYPQLFVQFLESSLSYNSFLVPKYFMAMALVFKFGTLWKIISKVKLKVSHRESRSKNQYSLEGVPVTEILDHLFEYQSFKHDDVVGENTKLKMSRKRFDKLAKKLESLEVLIRGENRARILNTEYSRSDIASMLSGKKQAKDIEPLLRKMKNSLISKPSAKEIEDRVNDSIDPSIDSISDSPTPSDFRIYRIGGGTVQTA